MLQQRSGYGAYIISGVGVGNTVVCVSPITVVLGQTPGKEALKGTPVFTEEGETMEDEQKGKEQQVQQSEIE